MQPSSRTSAAKRFRRRHPRRGTARPTRTGCREPPGNRCRLWRAVGRLMGRGVERDQTLHPSLAAVRPDTARCTGSLPTADTNRGPTADGDGSRRQGHREVEVRERWDSNRIALVGLRYPRRRLRCRGSPDARLAVYIWVAKKPGSMATTWRLPASSAWSDSVGRLVAASLMAYVARSARPGSGLDGSPDPTQSVCDCRRRARRRHGAADRAVTATSNFSSKLIAPTRPGTDLRPPDNGSAPGIAEPDAVLGAAAPAGMPATIAEHDEESTSGALCLERRPLGPSRRVPGRHTALMEPVEAIALADRSPGPSTHPAPADGPDHRSVAQDCPTTVPISTSTCTGTS